MTRIPFRTFFQTASLNRRIAMAGVGFAALVVIIGSVSSIFFILHRTPEDRMAARAVPRGPAAVAAIPPYTYRFELPNFSISLPSRGGGRTAYAQFSLVLDCPTLDSRRQLELNRARLRDTLLTASMPFGQEELRGIQGIGRYKERLLVELRTAFGANAPRDLSLENFLVH